jgi:hypothetical protein
MIIPKLPWALAAILAGVALAKHIDATQTQARLDRALHDLTTARGSHAACTARIQNIQEAETRNATLPDDLRNFDPREWLLIPE